MIQAYQQKSWVQFGKKGEDKHIGTKKILRLFFNWINPAASCSRLEYLFSGSLSHYDNFQTEYPKDIYNPFISSPTKFCLEKFEVRTIFNKCSNLLFTNLAFIINYCFLIIAFEGIDQL